VAERSYQSRVTDEAEFTRLRLLLADECERAEQAAGDTIKGKRGRLPAQVCTRPGCGKTFYRPTPQRSTAPARPAVKPSSRPQAREGRGKGPTVARSDSTGSE